MVTDELTFEAPEIEIHGYPLIEECALAVASVLVAALRAGHLKSIRALDISIAVHNIRVGKFRLPIRVGWARQAIEHRARLRINDQLWPEDWRP